MARPGGPVFTPPRRVKAAFTRVMTAPRAVGTVAPRPTAIEPGASTPRVLLEKEPSMLVLAAFGAVFALALVVELFDRRH